MPWWGYVGGVLLLITPWVEGYLEVGHWPQGPMEWFTEITFDVIVVVFFFIIVRQLGKLQAQNLELERLAMTDPLTQLCNRRTFDNMLDREVERSKRTGKFPSLVFMDIDQFKTINDQQGHAAGDEALTRVATAIRSAIRFEIDVACRYGGDEFVIILPETASSSAVKVGGRIQDILKPQGLEVSIGVIECQSGWSSNVFLHKVDQEMYAQKRGIGQR